jgi:cell division protein FtsW
MSGPRRNNGRHQPVGERLARSGLATVSPLRRGAGLTAPVAGGTAGRGHPRSGRRRERPPAPPAQGPVLVLSVVLGLLCVFGLVMVLSASAAEAQSDYGNPWYQFQRQVMWLGLGTAALLVASRVRLDIIRRLALPMVAITIGLLVLVLLPFAGQTVNGSSRWLALGPVTLQPSELAKLAVLVFAADLLARRSNWMDDASVTLRPVLAVFCTMALLIMLQPNLGTTVLLFAIVMSVLWMAGVKRRYLGVLVGVAVATVAGLAAAAPYRMRRLTAFVDPWADPLNTGYQTLQSQAALANGGVTGLGLGQGRAKFGFLPEGHTDFIFSTIGEEFGLFGSLFVIGLFAVLAALGAGVAMRTTDRFSMLVAVGVTTWISLQALVNLGAAVGVLPITGVPLPLVSSGGSSLIVTMAACGILLNIARHCPPATGGRRAGPQARRRSAAPA